MSEDFLDSALKEEARLVRRLASVRSVIADYRGGESEGAATATNAVVKRQTASRATRAESQAATVLRIAEEFLSTARRRAPSAEIYMEITGRGIVIPGQKPESVVSSYLSNSPKFDNVRGKGYGLREWSEVQDGHDLSKTDEAPARAEAPKESEEVEALFR
jgi:hypothetical protein